MEILKKIAKIFYGYIYEIKYLFNLFICSISKLSVQIMDKSCSLRNVLIKNAKRKGYRLINKKELLKHKNCDTLFVLGSGPSINEITESQWQHISNCNSIGFNFFLLHPFVPTYFAMEIMDGNFDLFKECYLSKSESFKNRPALLNGFHLPVYLNESFVNFIKNYYVFAPFLFIDFGAKTKNLEEIFAYYFRNNPYLLHYRASLSIMITFGAWLGYKNIVLAGVDLYSSEYFYSDEEKYKSSVAKKVRKHIENTSIKRASNVHLTVDPEISPDYLTIDKVIDLINKFILKPRDIKLKVFNKKSLLYPSLDLYQQDQ